FTRRYGDNKAVPLLEALDPDSGVRFGDERQSDSFLLHGIAFAEQGGSSKRVDSPNTLFERLLVRKFEASCRESASDIIFTWEDLEQAGILGQFEVPPSFF